MKKNGLLILSLMLCQLAVGQNFEPQILILTPDETKVEKSLMKEVVQINEKLNNSTSNEEQINSYLISSEFLQQPLNIQKMIKSEMEFSKSIDFFSQVSSISEQYLAYRFFERFPNLLIMLSNQKSDNKESNLKGVINNEKLQYILNFPSIEIYKDKSIPHAKIAVQLFDRLTETTILEKIYIGDWRNPGFEFACKDSTLNCTINNALSQALDDVIRVVAKNSPTLKRERQLAYDRFNTLLEKYLTGEINTQILNDAVPKSDSTINLSDCYQTMTDANQSKFVAFFIKPVSSQNFKQLTENKTDQNVQIITQKDIKDEGFLNEIPRTYAYLVKGVEYDNKWYYEKSNVTYFQPESFEQGKKEYFNNLQKWNFFQDDTTAFNPDFWETSLFEKVKDLKNDPDWDKYGDDMWMTQEINDRPYIGLYEIVARFLRKRNNQLNSEFENFMKTEIFSKYYKNLKNNNPDKYTKISPHSIICPTDRNIALNPVLITNQDDIKTIHYFVSLKDSQEVYEWRYFEPTEVPTTFYGSEVVNQIGSLTDWNFSVDNLNDPAFWNNYVLKKEDATYR